MRYVRTCSAVLMLAVFLCWAPRPAIAASPEAIVANNTVMLPLRAVTAWLGANLFVADKAATITVRLPGKDIIYTLNGPTALVNGNTVTLDAPPIRNAGITFVSYQTAEMTLDVTTEVMPAGVTVRNGHSSLFINLRDELPTSSVHSNPKEAASSPEPVTPSPTTPAITMQPITTPAFAGFTRLSNPNYRQTFDAGLLLYCRNYSEDVPSPFKSDESGVLPGIHLAYSLYDIRKNLEGRALFEYAGGKTNYDGSLQNGTPATGTTDNSFVTLEGTLGMPSSILEIGQYGNTTFYTGLGYHSWNRGLGGAAPFTETYRWVYAPVGIRRGFPINSNLCGTFDFSVRPMLWGNITVNLSETDSRLNDPTVTLGNRIGVRAELPLEYQLQPDRAILITPWYEYSAFGQSPNFTITQNGSPVATGYEPSSRTHQLGITTSLRMRF